MNVGDLIDALRKLDPTKPALVPHPAGKGVVEVTEVTASWPIPSPTTPQSNDSSSPKLGVLLW